MVETTFVLAEAVASTSFVVWLRIKPKSGILLSELRGELRMSSGGGPRFLSTQSIASVATVLAGEANLRNGLP